MNIIDRRSNPGGKSHVNRQRFIRRIKSHVRRAVSDAVRDSKIADVGSDGSVSIPAGGDISEPSFGWGGESGERDHVLPGNRRYVTGDEILKPDGGGGGRGRSGSADGDGTDEFAFVLTRDEFLELFFEDLRLPNLTKKRLMSMESPARQRAGLATDGSPSRLNITQTMRRSMARRIALGRPKPDELRTLLEELEQTDEPERRAELEREIAVLRRRMAAIAYIDKVDLRFNHFEPRPRPTTRAVMFCLMDTSASMTEGLKSLAKRFYILLHLFLTRHYKTVEIVFIRHTYTASEVDEETFFHGRETGGTIVSSALDEMVRIVKDRYPPSDWNIYAAQASDGHNFDHDMPRTLELLEREILPMCRYYAYIETVDEMLYGDSSLWGGYESLSESFAHFQRARVTKPGEIYPVFRQLFGAEVGR